MSVGTRVRARLGAAGPLVLVLWGLPWFLLGHHQAAAGLNDWSNFELGARALVGYTNAHGHTFDSGLHVYADHPFIQIGPPALLALVPFLSFSANAAAFGFGLLMVLALPLTVELLRRAMEVSWQQVLLPALIAAPFWCYWLAGYYRHLDDVLAMACMAGGLLAATRQRPVLTGLLLGTSMAAKPWAIVLVPLVLVLPRRQRALGALATLVAAGLWWGPFLLGDPGTAQALSGFALGVDPGSALSALGVHGDVPHWARSAQFEVGLLVTGLVALRRDWRLAVLAGFAVRVLLDPYAWPYYAAGPLLGALGYDAVRGRRLPVGTLVTVGAFYGVPALSSFHDGPTGYAKLVWCALALLVVARSSRPVKDPKADEQATLTPQEPVTA